MALLDRVKERIETDLSDTELQSMIDEVTAEIERRFGAAAAITVHRGGGTATIRLVRKLDTAEAVAVVEIEPANTGDAANRTALSADDYRVLHGGLTLERLIDGTNGRIFWAPLVEVTYTPVARAMQRDEIVIEVVQLQVQDRGLTSERAGDWSATSRDTQAARERLIASLAPGGGMVLA
jgi:hypothetical protein